MTLILNETTFSSVPNGFASVQIYNKTNTPFNSTKTLLVDPVTILFFGNKSDNSDIEAKTVDFSNDQMDICFSTLLPSMPAIECVYWDE